MYSRKLCLTSTMQSFCKILVFLSFSLVTIAQDCIDYATIEGAECWDCVPSGWETTMYTPDIVPPAGSFGPCDFIPYPASPAGGNLIHIAAGTGVSEAASTEICNLNTNTTYAVGVYVIALIMDGTLCNPCNVEQTAVITIDGTDYELPAEEDWELFETCIVPSSDCITIEVSGIANVSAPLCHFGFDNVLCSALDDCCPMVISYDTDDIALCPGDIGEFDIFIENSEGSINHLWECDPVEGLDFLSDLSIINPEVEIPEEYSSNGEVYTYTLTVEDDLCTKDEEFTLEILSDNICCELTIDYVTDGLIGCPGEFLDYGLTVTGQEGNLDITWTADPESGLEFLSSTDVINPTLHPGVDYYNEGELIEYTLTIEDDECVRELVVFYGIESNVIPTFEIDICAVDENFEFPTISQNGYEGTWEGNFDFEEIAGTYSIYTFTILESQDNCLESYDFEFFITPAEVVVFDYESEYCELEYDFYPLESVSQNNIEGDWDIAEFNPFILGSGEYSFTFTPNIEIYCAPPYTLDITVMPSEEPIFSIPESFCQSEIEYELPSISENNIEGEWDPEFLDLTEEENLAEAQFIPSNSDGCYDIYTHFYSVSSGIESVVFEIDPICHDNQIVNTSEYISSSISGSVSPAEIDLSTVNATEVMVNYIPDAQFNSCFSDTILVIPITQAEYPTLDFIDSICINSEFMLENPDLIIDGISSGSLFIDTLQSINSNDSIYQIIFEPFNNICLLPDTAEIIIVQPIDPQFDITSEFCLNSLPLELPTSSVNGMEGSWNLNIIEESSFVNNLLTIIFTPIDTCSNVYSQTLSLSEEIPILFNLPDKLCESDLPFIFPQSSVNGITGTWTQEEISFGDGNDLFINEFVPDDMSCYSSITDSISVLYIDYEIDVIDDNCGLGIGEIIFTAGENQNLEYSIDGGLTFQSDVVFDNLQSGNYNIQVRNSLYAVCQDIQSVVLENLSGIEIDSIQVQDNTNCSSPNGEITIYTESNNVEFSIDNGAEWQLERSFKELEEGEYQVIARDINEPRCADTLSITLLDFEAVNINEIIIQEISSCDNPNGIIEILSDQTDLEYSIDGGLNFSTNPVFDNLDEGSYNLIVINPQLIDCDLDTIVEIAPFNIEFGFDLTIEDTNCETDDGVITLINTSNDLEFSLDNNNWQINNVFENLSTGEYELYVRNIIYPDCDTMISLFIPMAECPCDPLEITTSIIFDSCQDGAQGEINITNISGPNDPQSISFQWSNGQSSQNLTSIESGLYTVSINYDNSCEWIETYEVLAYDPISFGLLGFDPDCVSLGSIVVEDVEGGAGSFLYSLDGINFQSGEVFFNLSEDDYLIIVNDLFGCEASETISLESDASFNIDLPTIDTINVGESIILNPLINLTTIDSFTWHVNGELLPSDNIILETSPTVTSTYELVVYFGNCSELRTITIFVEDDFNIYIPNIFNPSDITNNAFKPLYKSSLIEINSFFIFDRWGNKVFDQNWSISQEGWDGRYQGKELEIGVYIYSIEYTIDNKRSTIRGPINLIR